MIIVYTEGMDTETYYSISKAAELLPVSRQMVHKMYKSGKFPHAIDYEGAVRIPASDIRKAALARARELKGEAIKWEMVAA